MDISNVHRTLFIFYLPTGLLYIYIIFVKHKLLFVVNVRVN